MTRGRRCATGDEGSAIVEFVFVALLVLVPLVYLIVAVASVQRSRTAVTDAARDVGRAIAMGGGAPSTTDPDLDVDNRSTAALRISLANQGLRPSDVELRYVAAAASCDERPIRPNLAPGSEFAVCVVRRLHLPAVPAVLSGRGITTVGRYVVHLDDYAPPP